MCRVSMSERIRVGMSKGICTGLGQVYSQVWAQAWAQSLLQNLALAWTNTLVQEKWVITHVDPHISRGWSIVFLHRFMHTISQAWAYTLAWITHEQSLEQTHLWAHFYILSTHLSTVMRAYVISNLGKIKECILKIEEKATLMELPENQDFQ